MNTRKKWTDDAVSDLRRQHFDDKKTLEEIAAEQGLSKQRIAQIVGGMPGIYRVSKKPRSVWPSMDRWMRDNKISYVALAKMLGYSPSPSNYQRVRNQMLGIAELRKQDIDKLIKITGMRYERLFCAEGNQYA